MYLKNKKFKKNILHTIALLSATAVFFCSIFSCFAAEYDDREIVIGFYEDTEPLAFVNPDGSYDGVYPTLINDMKEKTGLNLVLRSIKRNLNWKDLLTNGDIDFYIGASAPIATLSPELIATDTIIDYKSILVTTADCVFNSIEIPTIALTYGRAYWADYLPQKLGKVTIIYYRTSKDCLLAVQRGEADGTMINNIEYNYQSKNPRFSDLITWENYRFVTEGGLVASADIDPDIFHIVNQALTCLDNNYIESVLADYLNMSYQPTFTDALYISRYILTVIAVSLLLILAAALAIHEVRRRQQLEFDRIKKQERDHLRILAALSHDYDAIYYTDLSKDTCKLIRMTDTPTGFVSSSEKHSEALRFYIENSVMPEYWDKLLCYTDPEEIIRRFKREKAFSERYRVIPDVQKKNFFEMHFVDASETELDHQMVFGVRCVDDAVKDEQQQKQLLRDALEVAQRASSAKSDFLSRMSHDIRTPLNAIIGMTAIAEMHMDEPERIRDALSKISASGDHLLSLINDVLDMSKIESGSISLNTEEFKLTDLLNETLIMIRPQVEEHHHTLHVQIHEIIHDAVCGDTLRIRQVLLNLLSNAVKYTQDGGEISLSVREKPANTQKAACFEFVCEDNGIGMSKEFLEQIFEPFARAEDLRISQIQGTGLGMPIVQNIVRMMNGSVEVQSEPGKGSIFTVTIFLRIQDAADKNRSEVVQTETNHKYGNDDVAGSQPILQNIEKNDFTERRILLVDDNELNREIAKEVFEMAGLIVDEAENGKLAAEKFAASEIGCYDMIFMDIQMPVMNGYDSAKAIREMNREDALFVPIIAMTANAFSEDMQNAKASGMNEHLAKPIDFEKLNRVLKKYLNDTKM